MGYGSALVALVVDVGTWVTLVSVSSCGVGTLSPPMTQSERIPNTSVRENMMLYSWPKLLSQQEVLILFLEFYFILFAAAHLTLYHRRDITISLHISQEICQFVES